MLAHRRRSPPLSRPRRHRRHLVPRLPPQAPQVLRREPLHQRVHSEAGAGHLAGVRRHRPSGESQQEDWYRLPRWQLRRHLIFRRGPRHRRLADVLPGSPESGCVPSGVDRLRRPPLQPHVQRAGSGAAPPAGAAADQHQGSRQDQVRRRHNVDGHCEGPLRRRRRRADGELENPLVVLPSSGEDLMRKNLPIFVL